MPAPSTTYSIARLVACFFFGPGSDALTLRARFPLTPDSPPLPLCMVPGVYTVRQIIWNGGRLGMKNMNICSIPEKFRVFPSHTLVGRVIFEKDDDTSYAGRMRT